MLSYNTGAAGKDVQTVVATSHSVEVNAHKPIYKNGATESMKQSDSVVIPYYGIIPSLSTSEVKATTRTSVFGVSQGKEMGASRCIKGLSYTMLAIEKKGERA